PRAISPLSLHDALPIYEGGAIPCSRAQARRQSDVSRRRIAEKEFVARHLLAARVEFTIVFSQSGGNRPDETLDGRDDDAVDGIRSEEHTSELQSRENLV